MQSRPPFPLIEMRIEPTLKAHGQKLLSLLDDVARTEPGFSYKIDSENEDILIGGMDELQLDHIISVLKVNGVDVIAGTPEVSYRETITTAVIKDYTHKRVRNGQGEFARVILGFAPLERDAGFVFENRAAEEAIPAQFIAGVEKGVRSVQSSGPLLGMPVVNVRVTLLDGAYHETDSSHLAFEVAARHAFRETIQGAGYVLLEPIVKVTVETPEDSVGKVIGDLNSRRGKVIGVTETDAMQTVVALVPLANMFGYINNLKQLTLGKGKYGITYSHYEPVSGPNDGPDLFPPAVGMRT
jgi:elongation factor G